MQRIISAKVVDKKVIPNSKVPIVRLRRKFHTNTLKNIIQLTELKTPIMRK